jgi:hypothetical protein
MICTALLWFSAVAMISGGIFGIRLCGKTTLAISLSREYYRLKGIRSLVLDPHMEDWGPQAWVTNNEEEFWRVVWHKRDCLVIVEEASTTINRAQKLMPVFTRLRHNKHRLLVIGHDGTDLLRAMRKQFDSLFLFQQDEDSCEQWAKIFPKGEVHKAVDLQQYEFLHVRSFAPTVKNKLTL